ncbi:MAG: YicC family protein [Sphingomonadales bacterium]|nr:YicC family protein [Sphingomonadales bacterium]
MAISSMTGFARATGQDHGYRWAWSLKSVNGRGLDVRCRVPPEVDGLDVEARKRIASRFQRGSVSGVLELATDEATERLVVNQGALEQLVEAVQKLGDRPGIEPARLDGLLAVRGVVASAQEAELRETLGPQLLKSLEAALDGLVQARAEEGESLVSVLNELLDTIDDLRGQAVANQTTRLDFIRDRLAGQMAELLGDTTLPEERLAQEVALLAVKADVREELDRLQTHVESARALVGSGEAVGRRLDFLAQELNREANTLSAKAADISLKNIGLELKAAIDQFREQIQNIE